MLPFSDLSYIAVIVKRIQNALFVLLAMTELIVRVTVSSNKIRRVVRSNKHSWSRPSSFGIWTRDRSEAATGGVLQENDVLKNVTNFTMKRDSSTGAFLWNWWNFFRNFFWKTSANDCFWQISVAWPSLLYTTKNIFQIFVSLVYRRYIFWFYKIANMHSFRVQL